MAWNPSPKVAAARDIARKFKKQQAIVLLIDTEQGTLELASYEAKNDILREALGLLLELIPCGTPEGDKADEIIHKATMKHNQKGDSTR